jgi:2-haloacid dehalogenase
MTTTPDHTGRPARPQLMVFDVNETLSDMSGMQSHFEAVGAPPALAAAWFASLLRDGFALTVTGDNPDFADLAATSLRGMLAAHGVVEADAAGERVMGAFTSLPVHDDVVLGVRALARAGIRLVTLSNGSTLVARGLVERGGIADQFERLLSVQDAPAWKPSRGAYEYALGVCDVAANESMLVAVHPWDIHGAAHAGMGTVWLNRSNLTYPPYFRSPDLQVGSLVELADVVGAA